MCDYSEAKMLALESSYPQGKTWKGWVKNS